MGHVKFVASRESPAGLALSSNSPVIIEDLATEARFRKPQFLLDHEVVSAATVIIHGRSRPYGVLGAYTIKRRKFTNDDIHFIQSVANVLAAAIDRRQLEEELLAISGREQQRIGQDLHDGLCQQLVGIEFRNSVLVQQLAKEEEAKTEATMIGELIRDAIRQARLLAKGLSPVQLDAAGLMSALHELASKRRNCSMFPAASNARSPCLLQTIPLRPISTAWRRKRLAMQSNTARQNSSL